MDVLLIRSGYGMYGLSSTHRHAFDIKMRRIEEGGFEKSIFIAQWAVAESWVKKSLQRDFTKNNGMLFRSGLAYKKEFLALYQGGRCGETFGISYMYCYS